MANMTLVDAKTALKTDKVFETETSFLVNVFGKYLPNMTFVVRKDFEGDPLAYRSDAPTREMLAGMNVSFDGKTEVLFGDFWASRKGGACFRPKPIAEAQHVLVRCDWGGAFSKTRGCGRVEGAIYLRRAVSNGGGTGYDYVVVPVGFYRAMRDEDIDGDATATVPNFAERAKAIRDKFAQYDREQVEKTAAAAEAKVDAEAMSRAAKAAGLGARLEAVNLRRVVLECESIELGDTSFGGRYNLRLYTEANIVAEERRVAELEGEAALKAEFEKLSAELMETIQGKGCHLWIGDPLSSHSRFLALQAEGLVHERRFSYTSEGAEELRQAWPKFLDEVEAKRAALREQAEKKEEEERLCEQGLPTDFTCQHERGHGKTHRQCWVIQPDGKEREADRQVIVRHKHEATVWNIVRPGEIALMWEKGSAAGDHYFTVVHMLCEHLTEAQTETICAILEGVEQRWEGVQGLASGIPSPSVGKGWLHPETGRPLTPGFRTSRQHREAGKSPVERPDLDAPIEAVKPVKSVAEGGAPAAADKLAALRDHFGSK